MNYRYKAQVTRVVDGDTIDCLVDLGFTVSVKQRFRLYGVNTPESRTRDAEEKVKGLAAKKFVMDRIAGKKVEVDITKGTGKYGRYLATVHYQTEKDGSFTDLNAELIKDGHAVEYFGGKRD